jgi:hypothetical protein
MKVKALNSQPIFTIEAIKVWLLVTLSLYAVTAKSQNFQVAAVGFYNIENLFDTAHSVDILDTEKFLKMEMPYMETLAKSSINTADYTQWKAEELADWLADKNKQAVGKILLEKNDYDFTSEGSLGNDSQVYSSKLENLAKVLSEMGTTVTPDGLAIIGIAEVEQRSCLEDLVKQPALKDRNYKIVHHNSMDFRGIDVGFIYSPKYFKLEKYHVVPVNLVSETGYRTFTRDILWVEGFLNGDKIHVFVNHWPSRSGGEQVTVEKRKAAAQVCKNILDSLRTIDPDVKAIVMGDLNDHPTDVSVTQVLRAVGKPEEMTKNNMYNPYILKFKKGSGSNAWRDTWGLFDQIMVTKGIVDGAKEGYKFYSSEIFNRPYLLAKTGQYRGYPYRSYIDGRFSNGYSDHLPVLIYLIKEIK